MTRTGAKWSLSAPALQPDPLPVPEPLPVENTRTIEIERFVPRDQIDPLYFDTPYYVTPRDEVGQEAYAVIRDAMRHAGMVGMGRTARDSRSLICAAVARASDARPCQNAGSSGGDGMVDWSLRGSL